MAISQRSAAMLILPLAQPLIMMLYLAAKVGDAVPPGPMFALMVFYHYGLRRDDDADRGRVSAFVRLRIGGDAN